MPWSFGTLVVLVCGAILVASLIVRVGFKRELDLAAAPTADPSTTSPLTSAALRPYPPGAPTTARHDQPRTPPTTRIGRRTSPSHSGRRRAAAASQRQASRAAARQASRTGLPRALRCRPATAPCLVLVLLGLAAWLYWRAVVTGTSTFDPWLIWTFNVVFALVAVQLLLAFAEPRRSQEDAPRSTAVLVPLYNEDPEVVHQMLEGLLTQSAPPTEVHVVDDGSTQESYSEQRLWLTTEAARRGIYATWQRTRNRGKRHAQAQAFQQIRDAEVFVTVDSDSVLDAQALYEITRPFYDPRVMSVAGVILAINNRVNPLARITDLIFVVQQLTDRSAMSRLGTVLVNSGGLAAYRRSVLSDNIELYMSETFLGRHVEFSDDSLLTLFSLLRGRTVQQPTAFAFAWMPDRWSHHYRQQVRWFRGSFIRGLWRVRFLPLTSPGWWRQVTGWMQLWVVSSVFVYLVIWRPLLTPYGIPVEVLLVPMLIGLAQCLRYTSVWRSDTSAGQRIGALLLSPLSTVWSAAFLRPLRLWGMMSSAKMGWNTRQKVEVTSEAGTPPATSSTNEMSPSSPLPPPPPPQPAPSPMLPATGQETPHQEPQPS